MGGSKKKIFENDSRLSLTWCLLILSKCLLFRNNGHNPVIWAQGESIVSRAPSHWRYTAWSETPHATTAVSCVGAERARLFRSRISYDLFDVGAVYFLSPGSVPCAQITQAEMLVCLVAASCLLCCFVNLSSYVLVGLRRRGIVIAWWR